MNNGDNNADNNAKGCFGRLALTFLVLVSVAGLAISCNQETTAPVPLAAQQPSASENVTAPQSEPATQPVASSAPAGQGQSSGSISAGTPGNTADGPAGSFGSFNLSPDIQTATSEHAPARGGLTVSAVGSATRAADEAYVVMIPEMRYGPSGPEQLSEDDRDDIVEKLGEIDIAETDIEFDYRGRYGETTISVAVDPNDIEEQSDAILEAVEEVVRRFDSHGLRFALNSSSCDLALSDARREAAPDAEDTADDLAEALGVERGAVIAALEDRPATYQTLSLTAADYDACATSASAPFYQLMPFDAEPEVKVSVGLHVTYAISPATTTSETTQ